ncbi:hypothetical protein ISS30_08365 [bacterium]|nr:hypothetical protein [bacterium]
MMERQIAGGRQQGQNIVLSLPYFHASVYAAAALRIICKTSVKRAGKIKLGVHK